MGNSFEYRLLVRTVKGSSCDLLGGLALDPKALLEKLEHKYSYSNERDLAPKTLWASGGDVIRPLFTTVRAVGFVELRSIPSRKMLREWNEPLDQRFGNGMLTTGRPGTHGSSWDPARIQPISNCQNHTISHNFSIRHTK